MATYKLNSGNILQPGAQINRLSSFNNEGVYAWPGFEAYELIGYVPISNALGTAANFKTLDLIVPSPDRRTDDRVRDNRTSMVVQASSARPAYVYGASIAVAQDIPYNAAWSTSTVAGTSPEPGFPANPVTCDLKTGNATDYILFGPDNSGNPFGIPSPQGSGLSAASAYLQAASNTIAQGASFAPALLPFTTTVTTGGITAANFADSMFYKATSNLTMRVYSVTGTTSTTATGNGLYIAADPIAAGQQAYIVCRINYLRPAAAASWNDIQGFIDFASQVGGNDS
jgi:hypothetical protein